MLCSNMIVASLTLPPPPHLRELCAKTHTQPRRALSCQSTSLALIPRQLPASLDPHTNPRNPFPLMALLHTSLYGPGVGVYSRLASRASSQIAANSIRIRTYQKHTRNPFRICTSRTKDLKSFTMSTYEKRGGGTPPRPAPRLPPEILASAQPIQFGTAPAGTCLAQTALPLHFL
jgi:hypothetical protein